jgi:succinate dehydrogenase / fumarate reductase iron-sulfur subunit
MARKLNLRIWRGDSDSGELKDVQVEVNEGEVVLDVIHRVQATQMGDLAVRWNCKAGKCGSCSMEINGKPRLACMTQVASYPEGETITVTPLRAFPVIKDLVTDVSFNYKKAMEIPAYAPPADLAPGDARMQQVDVERSQEFRKCIECFLVSGCLSRSSRPRREQEVLCWTSLLHSHRRARYAPIRYLEESQKDGSRRAWPWNV